MAELGRKWEWEETPEVSLVVVDDADEASNTMGIGGVARPI